MQLHQVEIVSVQASQTPLDALLQEAWTPIEQLYSGCMTALGEEAEMLSPLVHIALVAHANLLGNVDGGSILRWNEGNQAGEAELLESIVFERLRAFQSQAALPVLWCQHIPQFHLWLPLYLLI